MVAMRARTLPTVVLSSLALAAVACTAATAEPAQADAALPEDCFELLEKGTGAEIACAVPLRLSPTEQEELEKGSRGYVKNVACTLTIRIARGDIDRAIGASELVFESPAQPGACSVTTRKSTFDITGTFAPRIVIRGDIAVEATPGLADVKGVTRFISWPVVQFVNRWPSVKSSMLQIVNAYRTHARKKQQPQSAPPR